VLVNAGAPSTVTMVEADAAEKAIPEVEIVTKTCVVPAVVPDPIVTFKEVDVPPTSEQLVVVPPKVALHEAAASCAVVMKLVPNTVMVSPM
jgi:hypothetical protein